ncbi:chymotrypsin-2 [Diachasma alloeum]|uniref:chymotrypsin-2 n=1 Tax=Diachasma alloeum TaxID=454923 RepID=UPI0007384AA5|nr:chymotrypsin-2 [Diachasma alloeum]
MLGKFRIFRVFCIFMMLCTVIEDGRAKPPARIIGGVNASIEEFPSLVSIHRNGVYICGGTLITNKHVLTAGHCAVLQLPKSRIYNMVLSARVFTVYAGSNSSKSSENSLKVEEVHVHDNYTGDSSSDFHDDIAILTLKTAVEESSEIRPIALASRNTEPGEIGIITGWGATTLNGPYSSTLKKALTMVHENEDCWTIPDTQLCAVISYGIGFCDGDSGGPLVINNEVVGVISNAEGCGEGFPDVFTRVFSYLTWIREITHPKE